MWALWIVLALAFLFGLMLAGWAIWTACRDSSIVPACSSCGDDLPAHGLGVCEQCAREPWRQYVSRAVR